MSQPESRLSSKIIRAIEQKGGFAYKNHGSEYTLAGLPDICACVEGRFYGLEVKLPGRRKNTTTVQQLVLSKIRGAGGSAAVVTSVGEALRVCGLGEEESQSD